MCSKVPPTPQPSFSRRFNEAMVTSSLINAMVKADGWNLDTFTDAPDWVRQLYNRHAAAAYKNIQTIEANENNLKPSEHD